MATSQHRLANRDGPQDDTAARISRLLAELAAPEAIPGAEPAEEPLRPGDRLDRFEIRAELGRGGFGAVYEAWDGVLQRNVALKTLRPVRMRSAGSAESLKQEAEAVAKLNHVGIVTLHDVCHTARGHYLVMERLEGITLAQRLRNGPLPWRDAVRIAAEIAAALAHAHRRGVLHRDLKPANVFLCEDGPVKLLDFGLAHLLGSGVAESGGTPAYMAPEQALNGGPIDGRADVFALGIVLAEMITGALPYRSSEERGVAAGQAAPRLAPAPVRLAKLMARMLARDPGGRPAGGPEAEMELAALQRSIERRSRAWISGTVGACAVAIAAGLALQPARLPAGRLVVVMADLENRTGDPNLDGVGELFGAALEQSRRVSLMDRDTLVRLLTNGGLRPKAIREAEAIAAARAAPAQLVLVPSLRIAPGGFELEVQVVDMLRGRSIFLAREKAAAQQSLYAATDRLAVRVRKALAEETSEAPRNPAPVADYAPARPEALRLYVEGERLYSDFDASGAKAKWDAAIALDPLFPLPRLSLLQGSLGTFLFVDLERQVALEHARALRRDLARLPAGLRPWAETVIVKVEDGYANHTEYLAALDAAIAARPEQPAPYFTAVNELLFRRGDGEAARPYVDRAVQLTPLVGLGDLVDYLVLLDRLDEALDQARLWTEAAPSPLSFRNLCLAHSARGETEEALAASRTMEETWGFFCAGAYVDADRFEELDAAVARSPPRRQGLRWMDSDLPALRGRVRHALRILDGAPSDALRSAETATNQWRSVRAAVLLLRGDREAVERAIGEATRESGPLPNHAWLLAEAGDVRLARALGRPASDRLIGHRMARALHTWKSGEPDAALAELGAITNSPSNFHRGEILAELGRHREAVEAFRRYRRLRHGDAATMSGRLEHWFLPRSLYLEASSLEALGEREEARRVIERLLRLWASADPDLPLLAQATALQRRLRSE